MTEPLVTNVLQFGDCFDLMKALPAACIDAVISDFPYNVTAHKWDVKLDLPRLWASFERILTADGIVITTSKQPFTTILINSQPTWFRDACVWQKHRVTGYLDASRRPLRQHEDVLIFAKKGRYTYNPQMRRGRSHLRNQSVAANCYGAHVRQASATITTDLFYPTTILDYSADPEMTQTLLHRPDKLPRHPTQKPLALYENLVLTYTNAGAIVLDPFAGSATTAIAALNTGRQFIAYENDPANYKLAQQRLAAWSKPSGVQAITDDSLTQGQLF